MISYSLSKASQFAQYEKTKEQLTDFLTDIFKDVQPCPYHYYLTKYNWRKIFTTNIDDVVENVYRKNRFDLRIQNTRRKSTLLKEGTEYIKLHGCVNNPSEGYTFGSEDYINSMQSHQDYRFNSLSFDMQTENLIFVGTSFDEINIDYYLKLYENTGYYSSKGQLFFITPNPSLFFNSRIRNLKGIIIKWTSEEFLNFLNSLNYNEDEQQHFEKKLLYSGYFNFKDIKANYQPSREYDSQLYFGYEPKWNDIFSEWDFINPMTHTILEEIINTKMSEKISYFSIIGKAYVGKSCALIRIAAELYKNGFEVISFNGRYFDIGPFMDYFRSHKTKKRFALILDNASYYYYLLERFSDSMLDGRQLIILTTSRPYYHLKRRYYLSNRNFKEYYFDSRLDESYSKIILQKLKEKGFLGELTKLRTEGEQIKYLLEKNDLMAALLGISYGEGFMKRFMRDINPILQGDSIEKDILVNLAIFDKAELPSFPVELISILYDINIDDFKDNIDNFIKNKQSSDMSIRSGIFTNRLLSIAGAGKVLESIREILNGISPQIDEYTTNYWKVIFEALCKVKILRYSFRIPILDIKKLMYELKDYYNDISYYWLQLGLSEQGDYDFDKALNHFRQAESIRPHSYHIQHVIGRNFLMQANHSTNFDTAEKLFKEGEKKLLSLIQNKEVSQVRSYSIHCYLFEKINFARKFNLDISNKELQTMFQYLEKLIEKDKNDIMAKNMSNYFYKFLKSRNKAELIKIDFYDLGKYMYLFRDIDIDKENLLTDFDID